MTTDIHKAGTADGWHGVIEEGGQFPPEKGRYHLYIGLFCPFAHRASAVLHLKGLTEFIGVSIVGPWPKGENGKPGWRFPQTDDEYPNATVDKLYGSKFLHELYFKADKDYQGRYSVPVLWDAKTETIVNTESAEILRFLPTAFNTLLSPELAATDLYPSHLRAEIDKISAWTFPNLEAGVYKTARAQTQQDYQKAAVAVFAALNKLEAIAAKNGGPFLLGQTITELDVRTYAPLIRFDAVYVQLFMDNLGTIRHNYPVLNNWLKNLYWNVKAFKETTDFQHIKDCYFKGHLDQNPSGFVPLGPFPHIEEGYEQDWSKLRPGRLELPEVLEFESKL